MTISGACSQGWHEDCPATNDPTSDEFEPCSCTCGHKIDHEASRRFWDAVARVEGRS